MAPNGAKPRTTVLQMFQFIAACLTGIFALFFAAEANSISRAVEEEQQRSRRFQLREDMRKHYVEVYRPQLRRFATAFVAYPRRLRELHAILVTSGQLPSENGRPATPIPFRFDWPGRIPEPLQGRDMETLKREPIALFRAETFSTNRDYVVALASYSAEKVISFPRIRTHEIQDLLEQLRHAGKLMGEPEGELLEESFIESLFASDLTNLGEINRAVGSDERGKARRMIVVAKNLVESWGRVGGRASSVASYLNDLTSVISAFLDALDLIELSFGQPGRFGGMSPLIPRSGD